MVTKLSAKRGISAPALNSIPDKWSPEWFRSFITQFLVDIDLRNAVTSGITIGGNVSGNNSNVVGTPVTAGLSPIPNNTLLGNVSGGTAAPVPLTAAQMAGSGITSIVLSPGVGSYRIAGQVAALRVGSGSGSTSITLTSVSFVPGAGDVDYGYASFGGSVSPTSVGGYTILQLFSGLDTVVSTYGDRFRIQASTDPGASLFSTLTVGSTVRNFSAATYTYNSGAGTAEWLWSGTPYTAALFQSTGSISVSIA